MQATLSYHTQLENSQMQATVKEESSYQGHLDFKISENDENNFLNNQGFKDFIKHETIMVEEGRNGELDAFPTPGYIISASVDIDP